MRNYVIGLLVVAILVMGSIIYKNETSPRNRFPALEEGIVGNAGDVEVPLFLYVFFHKKNCHDCLEIIEVLNNLPPQFIVIGLVPESELKDEKELRQVIGAAFPLISAVKYKKFIPFYTPTIIGVSPERDILFILPGVPGESAYLKTFLDSLYAKLHPIFLKDKIKHYKK